MTFQIGTNKEVIFTMFFFLPSLLKKTLDLGDVSVMSIENLPEGQMIGIKK